MGNELGDLIRRKRKAKGWTQTQLAQKLGTTQVAVSDWENGKTGSSKLAAAGRLLGITDEDLKLAMAGQLTDDSVVQALMATQRINAEVRDALLTLYKEAARAHQRQNDET